MKILRLSLKNLHSLKGSHTIDFTESPLSTAGIFAITGPTGSGKSTLLDAISLALFNQTPRMGKLSKSTVVDFGSIITKNTDDCYAEVEYEVKECQYRSRWEISKARTGNYKDYEMEVSRLPGGEILCSKRRDVPVQNYEIIGLSYDQFVKAIMLSQGEFAKFLKADPDVRGELLERITGTEIYRELGKSAFLKHKDEKQREETLNLKLEGIELIADEDREVHRNRLDILENELVRVKTNLTSTTALLQVKTDLLKIKNELQILNQKRSTLEEKEASAKEQLVQLERHKTANAYSKEITDIKNINSILYETQGHIKSALLNEEKLLQKLSELNEIQHTTRHELENEEKAFAELKPFLKLITALDAKISNTGMQVREAEEGLVMIKERNAELKQEFESKNLLLTQNKIKHDHLKTWLKQHEQLAILTVELPMLENMVNQLKHLEQMASQEIGQCENPSLIDRLTTADWNEKLSIVTIELKKVNDELSELEKNRNYELADHLMLQHKIDQLRDQLVAGKELGRIDRDLADLNTNLSRLNGSKKSIEIKINDLNKIVDNTYKSLDIQHKYIEELQARKDRQLLEKKYELDRQHLEEGKPCLLCGSTVHPYVNNYESKLDATIYELNEKQQLLQSLTKQYSTAEKQLAVSRSELQNYTQLEQTQRQEHSNKLLEKQEITEKFTQFKTVLTKSDLDGLLETITKQGIDIKTQLTILERLKGCKDKLKVLKYILDKINQVVVLEDSIKSKTRTYSSYTNPYESVELQLVTLTKKSKDYRSQLDREQVLIRERQRAESDIATTEALIKEQERVMAEDDVKHAKLAAYQRALLKERKQAFGEKNPETEELTALSKLQASRKKLEMIDKEILVVLTRQKETAKQLNELAAKDQQLSNELEVKTSELTPKIKADGFSDIKDTESFILTKEQQQQAEKLLDMLKHARATFEQSFSDKKAALNELEKKDDITQSIEEIASLKMVLDEKLQSNNQEKGAITSRLSEDDTRRVQAQKHLDELTKQQKETMRWAKLNRLIGDAEGKKFSKFAQDLTLNQLVSLANRHLGMLSDRYLLTKGDSNVKEDLIVVDIYQGASQRSVRTLSGGESFLVSLSLALGLSDLAGRNTKIDSLFIDEGFGALDQETLDVALNALEKLQNQSNITIGIISHIDAVKERIRTQVELTKASSGYSTITIKN